MKKQYFQAEVKEVEVTADAVKIKGFASTPDVDRYNDSVDPKAFKSSIEQYMKNPIILLQHNANKPIGFATEYKITKKGLYIECSITNDIDGVFKNITDGVLRTFSIGFIPKKWRYEEQNGTELRIIEDLDLIENSIVSTPANGQAVFSLSKSIKAFFDNLDPNDNLMKKKNPAIADEAVATPAEEIKETDEEVTETDTPDTEEAEEAAPVETPEEVQEDGEKSIEDVATIVDESKETDEAPTEEAPEGTNPESLEEGESADESSATEEAPAENAEETPEENQTTDQEGEKSFDTQSKKSLDERVIELESNLKAIVEVLELFVTDQTAIKKSLNSIPQRKGFVSHWAGEKELSAIGKALETAKKSIS